MSENQAGRRTVHVYRVSKADQVRFCANVSNDQGDQKYTAETVEDLAKRLVHSNQVHSDAQFVYNDIPRYTGTVADVSITFLNGTQCYNFKQAFDKFMEDEIANKVIDDAIVDLHRAREDRVAAAVSSLNIESRPAGTAGERLDEGEVSAPSSVDDQEGVQVEVTVVELDSGTADVSQDRTETSATAVGFDDADTEADPNVKHAPAPVALASGRSGEKLPGDDETSVDSSADTVQKPNIAPVGVEGAQSASNPPEERRVVEEGSVKTGKPAPDHASLVEEEAQLQKEAEARRRAEFEAVAAAARRKAEERVGIEPAPRSIRPGRGVRNDEDDGRNSSVRLVSGAEKRDGAVEVRRMGVGA